MYKKIILFLLLTSCSLDKNKNEQNTSENQENSLIIRSKGINVNTQTINSKIFQNEIIANGQARAREKSELRFKTSEHIAKIYVKNGQYVAKGKLLANLDNQLLYNRLQLAKIQFQKVENVFEEEKIRFGQGGKNNLEIDTTIFKSLTIRTGLLEAKNQLENARILYEQTLLRAPFSGIIANSNSKEGNLISPTDIFCTIINQNEMETIFSVLENELFSLEVGKNVKIIPFINKNKTYTGEISEINPFVNENGLVRIKARIIDNDNKLYDGMNVKILIIDPIENVLVIPKDALVLRSNREVVFTVENGFSKWNYVELSHENSNNYAISKGLQFNDTIIISGNLNLSHDAKVNSTFIEPSKD